VARVAADATAADGARAIVEVTTRGPPLGLLHDSRDDSRVGEALLDSLIYLLSKDCAVGWSCLLAAAAENTEQGRVGVGWCCYPHRCRDRDSGAHQYFDHQ